MEPRKITVINSSTQETKSFMSSACSLGELKRDLQQHNIPYENMDFLEGISKTQLRSDESVLPTNLPYKGQVTNDLVFMLSTSNKRIASGTGAIRTELYNDIELLIAMEGQPAEEFFKGYRSWSLAELEQQLKVWNADVNTIDDTVVPQSDDEDDDECIDRYHKVVVALFFMIEEFEKSGLSKAVCNKIKEGLKEVFNDVDIDEK